MLNGVGDKDGLWSVDWCEQWLWSVDWWMRMCCGNCTLQRYILFIISRFLVAQHGADFMHARVHIIVLTIKGTGMYKHACVFMWVGDIQQCKTPFHESEINIHEKLIGNLANLPTVRRFLLLLKQVIIYRNNSKIQSAWSWNKDVKNQNTFEYKYSGTPLERPGMSH